MLKRQTTKFMSLGLGAVLALVSSLEAQAAKKIDGANTEYGKVYLVEQQDKQRAPFEATLSGSYEFSNPYVNTYSVSVSALKTFGKFLGAGIEFNKHSSSETSLTSEVRTDLDAQGIRQVVIRPQYSVYGFGQLIPFSGYLNFFGNQPFQFDLVTNLGFGLVKYSGNQYIAAGTWSIGPRAFLTSTVGVHFTVGQEIELGSNSVFRTRGKTGVTLRF